MDDARYGFFLFKNPGKGGCIVAIGLIKGRFRAENPFKAFQYRWLGIIKVIHQHRLKPGFCQLYNGMGTNKTGSSGHKYFHWRIQSIHIF